MITVFWYTDRGKALAGRIAAALRAAGHEVREAEKESRQEVIGRVFRECSSLVFVSAAGIAVRLCAPFVRDKFTDPAVLSVDEAGRFVIPLLSGHLGGANRLAEQLAAAIGAVPVISTATDVNGLFSVDDWAREQGLLLREQDRETAKEISAALLRGEKVLFCSEFPVQGSLPTGLKESAAGQEGQQDKRLESQQESQQEGQQEPMLSRNPFLISVGIHATNPHEIKEAKEAKESKEAKETKETKEAANHRVLPLIPHCVCLGIGCRKGTDPETLRSRAEDFLGKHGILKEAVAAIASIDLKKEEPALLQLAGAWGIPFRTFSAEELRAVPGSFRESEFVRETTGVGNVCERAAAAVFPELLLKKESGDGITFAASIGRPALAFPKRGDRLRMPALVTGGAFQGKTAFAEKLANQRGGEVIRLGRALLERNMQEREQEREQGQGGSAESLARELLEQHPTGIFVLQSVGDGIVPLNRAERDYRDFSGQLSQALAREAGEVWELCCGIPRRLK